MSAQAEYFLVGGRRHDALLEVLQDLEAVQLAHPDEPVPAVAIQAQASIWEYLKAYGRRDERGHVDELVTPPVVPWRPSEAQLLAHAAGLPVPPDEGDEWPESEVRDERALDHAHPQQVGMLGTQRQLEGERLPVFRRPDLGVDADVLGAEVVGLAEASADAAGSAVEVANQGVVVAHEVSMVVRRDER